MVIESSSVVLSGGVLTSAFQVYDSQEAVEVTIQEGGVLTIFSGGKGTNLTEDGGYVDLADGATATFLPNVIESRAIGDQMTLHSGTTAANDTVSSGGLLAVFEGGSATDIALKAGGKMYVWNGGTATGVSGNGNLNVQNGGAAKGVQLTAGGEVWLSAGGILEDLSVTSGYVYVNEDALLFGAEVTAGRMFLSGGTALKANVNAGDLVNFQRRCGSIRPSGQ